MMLDSRAAQLRGIGKCVLVAVVALGLPACSGGGGGSKTAAPNPTAAQPTVTLSAMPASITAGTSTTLNWTSTNATSCVASGGWNGARPTSGSETFNSLTQNTSFTLTCTGAGGSGAQSVQVNVTATNPMPTTAPTLTFSASQSDVPVNSSVTLTWSTTNATACTASGAWSGARPTAGTEMVGPLSTSSTYTLTCSGPVGTPAQRSAIVAVSGPSVSGGLNGSVDSSMIDVSGTNQIYVFNNAVTPRDTQGSAGDAVFKLPVVQDPNACTFSYALPSLAMGTYTIAFTAQGQLDRPTQADALTFFGTTTVTVGNQAVRRDFRAATVLQVGPGKQFATIAAAAAAANPGNVIEVDAAGTYTNDIVVFRDNGVVVRGVNGRAAVRGTAVIDFASGDDRRNGKGLFVAAANKLRFENLEISGARVRDQNGAAIRNEGRDLTICNSFMHDNENGFLGGALGTLTIEYSIFDNNGFGDGQTHNVYVDEGSSVGDRLVFRHNYSHRARIGHNLKTRARENFVLYNRIMDETDGTASYAIDFSDGGLAYVIGNLLQQGPNTDNPDIIAFNAENTAAGRPQELYLVNNTFANDLGRGAFLNVRSTTTTFRSINNLFVGSGTLYSGKQPDLTTNLQAAAAVLQNAAGFEYRLNAGVAPINAGSNPGSIAGVSLVPEFQYVHPARREPRVVSGATDVGAYEAAP